ncbi:MAG: four helix bundle protein [Chitinophagaceae bacterium]|nr:four helix bundle protein [Chitinophagaceae bacterium]
MLIFENLEVYKKAYSINQKIYRFLKHKTIIARYVRDQLGRATLSIQLNIAEDSGRFAKKDRRNFYVTARGSTFECAALLLF